MVNVDQFHLPEGIAFLQVPTGLSPDSYADLKDWLELELRSIGKRLISTEWHEVNGFGTARMATAPRTGQEV
jgi:hypothetical protein